MSGLLKLSSIKGVAIYFCFRTHTSTLPHTYVLVIHSDRNGELIVWGNRQTKEIALHYSLFFKVYKGGKCVTSGAELVIFNNSQGLYGPFYDETLYK